MTLRGDRAAAWRCASRRSRRSRRLSSGRRRSSSHSASRSVALVRVSVDQPMSSPARSTIANGPIGKPKSYSTLVDVLRRRRLRAASLGACGCARRSMRLPMKPGHTPDSTATLPMLLADLHRRWRAPACEVLAPRTTSSSRITLAGEKKCRPTTASGREVADAISSMFRYEVLEARIAPWLDDLVELGEDLLLDPHVLEHRLDDQVAVGQRLQVERRR